MSPLPLGIVSASGAAAGSIDYIGKVSGNDSSVTLTFSNVPQTYKHLYLIGTFKIQYNSSSFPENSIIRFNGSSQHQRDLRMGEGSWGYYAGSNSTDAYFGMNPGNASPGTTQDRAIMELMIFDYRSGSQVMNFWGRSGAWNDTSRFLMTGGGNVFTSAITSISFNSGFAWLSATEFSLYGIKG